MRRLVLTVQGHSGNWVAFSLTNNSELSVSRYYEHGRILKPRRFFWRPRARTGCHHESRGHNCPKNDSQDNTAGQSEYDYGRANQCIADNATKSGRQRPFGVCGQQLAKPAAIAMQSTQQPNRSGSRSKSRWLTIRQPHTAIGRINVIDPRPRVCIRRSAPIAPG